MTSDDLNLTVLAGPTAVGKGTVSRKLLELHPEIYLSISATTRAPREHEIDGVHYHFIDRESFEKKINDQEFLEYAVVHGVNLYGTLWQPILDANKAGRPALLEIDLQGARQVKEIAKNAKFIFLAPPSFEELVTRLGMRGTEPLEERKKRLETAHQELAAQNEFDYVVVNDDVNRAVAEIEMIMGLN
ncbi:MAG: guanylate kinase [Candidatus Ancillula sp.]|jgi:guanylate kinase|nr:guanylate kinase [Candidatus Ancillula sp.]